LYWAPKCVSFQEHGRCLPLLVGINLSLRNALRISIISIMFKPVRTARELLSAVVIA
jgi:hypothetical protein